jgi:hypothetical protein
MNIDKAFRPRAKQMIAVQTRPQRMETSPFTLMKIKTSTVASSPKFIWKYTLTTAIWDSVTFTTGEKQVDLEWDGYSISEMGNTSTVVAFGVPLADLPANVEPVKIPDGVIVLCYGQLDSTGKFFYVILNTQAITGTCE